MANKWTDKRPMSPHLSVWKWHPAMRSSILHRAAVVLLYIAFFKICIWLALFASGEGAFNAVSGLLYSPLGAFAFFVFCLALIYHTFVDLRHVVWDAGKGLDAKTANTWSNMLLMLAILLAAVLTFILVRSFK